VIQSASPRASIPVIPVPVSIRGRDGCVSGRIIASTVAIDAIAVAAITAAIAAIATGITATAARETPLIVRADDPTTFNDGWVAASTPARLTAAMISAAIAANRIAAIAVAAITAAIRKTQIAGVC
jgi:hypothetical protein